jgi:hypothetical protein
VWGFGDRGAQPLRPQEWNLSLFVRISKLPASPAKVRAYQSARELLGRSNAKLLREWEVFTSFCQTAGFAIEPADVVMLDPNSSDPPPPDLKCCLTGEPHFFELGEILQKDIAEASSPKTRQAIVVPRLPLAIIWGTLQEMLTKKLGKNYDLEARPISLLLYYDRGPSFWEFLCPLIYQNTTDIQRVFDTGIFDNMWLFDATQRQVLFHLSRSLKPFIQSS